MMITAAKFAKRVIGHRKNDGVVPVWSQPFGKVLGTLPYDHAAVVNHFNETPREMEDVFNLIFKEI